MNRRTLLSVLGASVFCTCCGGAAHAKADIRGPCGLDMRMVGQSAEMPLSFVPWRPTDGVDPSSGNASLESALGVLLVHMSRFFDVRPQFGFIVETDGPNAFATPYNADRSGYPDGTVAFGRRLLDMQLGNAGGDFVVMAICAHEFGHIRQYRDGYIDIIWDTLPRYCSELHADFLAGSFVSYWQRMMPPSQLTSIGQTWGTLGSSDFNNPGSHGTSAQRIRAIEAGYFFREGVPNATIGEIEKEGYRHVSQYG